MKIAVVIEQIEAWRGGAETSTLELSRGLAARGHEVHLVTTSDAQSPPGITIDTIRRPKVLRQRRTAAFVRRAGEFVGSRDFDLVHAITPLPTADVYQPRGGLLGEVVARNVATRRTASRRLLKRALLAMNVKHRAFFELERKIFRPGGPCILAVSEYVERQCRRLYDCGPPRVRVVRNGVKLPELDPEARRRRRAAMRKEYGIAEDTVLLLFIAHNFRLKGLFPLIDTASRLVVSGFRRFHLLVVGRDNVVPFQRRANALGLNSYSTFTGPTQRAAEFFLGADACVHPTYYDPCSRVVLEALAHGLPVITTSYNGAAEFMQDGREGFVIQRPDDLGLWARRIQDLASPELRRSMSDNALKLRERISMARHVEELVEVYGEIVEKKRCGVGTE